MPPYVLPTPRTWPANGQIKAPYLRADVSDAVALLSAPPMFTAHQGTAQSIANNAVAPVNLDAEDYDNLGGHLTTSNSPLYYGMFPGYYLLQGTVPLNYTGGVGVLLAGTGISLAGGAVTLYTGSRLPASATAGRDTTGLFTKLALFTNTGVYGGATNDYAQMFAEQTSGAAQNLQVTANQFPQFSARWICAPTGTNGLPVPPLATAPSPITSAWLNANIRDTIRFLTYPPLIEYVYTAGTATLPTAAALPLIGATSPVDTSVFDTTTGAFSTATHTFTAPVAGVYWCSNQVALTGAATSLAIAAGLTVTSANYNGGTQITLWDGTQAMVAAAAAVTSVIIRRRLRLNAGDTILPAAWYHDSGAAAATYTGTGVSYNNRLIVFWAGT